MSFGGFSRSLLQSDWDQISWMPSSSWSMSLPTNDNDYDLNRIIQNSAPENPAGINRINIDQRQFGVDSLACHFWPQLRYTIPATSSGAYVEVSCSGRWRGRTCVFPPKFMGIWVKGSALWKQRLPKISGICLNFLEVSTEFSGISSDKKFPSNSGSPWWTSNSVEVEKSEGIT